MKRNNFTDMRGRIIWDDAVAQAVIYMALDGARPREIVDYLATRGVTRDVDSVRNFMSRCIEKGILKKSWEQNPNWTDAECNLIFYMSQAGHHAKEIEAYMASRGMQRTFVRIRSHLVQVRKEAEEHERQQARIRTADTRHDYPTFSMRVSKFSPPVTLRRVTLEVRQ